MKITIEMLLTRFFQEHPEAVTPFFEGDKEVLGIRLLPTDPTISESDYLYVSDNISKSIVASIPDNVSVVFFPSDKDPAFVPGTKSNVIILNQPFELAHGFNDLQQAANSFFSWERELEFSVFKGDGFQKLIDISAQIFASAMLVYDPALKLLAWSKNQEKLDNKIFQNAIRNGYMDINSVHYFEQKKDFERIHEEGSSFGEVDAIREHADYIRAINVNQQLTVYCVLLFTDKLPRSYECQLFDILCDSFYQLLQNRHSTFVRDRSVTDYFLMDLLDNPETSEEQIRERLLYLDLDYEDNYILLSIHSEVRKKSAEQFFLQYIRNNMIHCQTFSYKDCIIILIRLPKQELLSYRTFISKQTTPILHEFTNNHPLIFISKPFETILQFAGAYRQTENTRSIISVDPASADYHPDHATFFFEDYWVQDLILQNPITDKTFFYCEPCLLDLLKKDTKKSRQQIQILHEYLICDRNYSDAAAKLSMHRNNVIYHIKNIEAQYNLDLNDASVRLKLLLSFELLKDRL